MNNEFNLFGMAISIKNADDYSCLDVLLFILKPYAQFMKTLLNNQIPL